MKRPIRSLSYPVDVEAERDLISIFITGRCQILTYHAVSGCEFFVSEHRIILHALAELDEENVRKSRKALIRQLEKTGKSSPNVLSALEAIPQESVSESKLQTLRKRIVDCDIGRRLIHRLENTTRWLADGDIDSEKFLQWTTDALVELKEFALLKRV